MRLVLYWIKKKKGCKAKYYREISFGCKIFSSVLDKKKKKFAKQNNIGKFHLAAKYLFSV
jgi:hypothetical protein